MTEAEISEVRDSPEYQSLLRSMLLAVENSVFRQPSTGKYLCTDANGVYCTDVGFTGDCPHKKE